MGNGHNDTQLRISFSTIGMFALLAVHASLLAYSAYVHSPSLNEPGHLVAGLSNWRHGRYCIYKVNPPLVRQTAALGVLVSGARENWEQFEDYPGARPEFVMGEDLVKANGNAIFSVLMLSRWFCIPFSLIGGAICFFWGRMLRGDRCGHLACLLWCFSPSVIGHGSLVTPDVGAASLAVATIFFHWIWFRTPSWNFSLFSGVALGLAQLAKFTNLILFPVLAILWLFRFRQFPRESTAMKEFAMLLFTLTVGMAVLNVGYGFEGSFTPLGKFRFVSVLFAGEPNGTEFGNRFSSGIMSEIPVPFPKNYLLGIDLQQRDFEHYGGLSYLRGSWKDQGWWWYYIYGSMVKMPIGFWVLFFLAILAPQNNNSMFKTGSVFLLVPAIAFLGLVSCKTGFNEHFRYALPVLPFVFIWTSCLGSA